MNPKRIGDGCLQLLANPVERLLLLAIAAVAMTLYGVPHDRQDEVLKLIGMIFAAAVLARGYHLGKSAEGTVPSGSTGVAGSAVNVNIGQAAPESPLQQAADEAKQAETVAAAVAAIK